MGEAVNVTDIPAHTGLAEAAIETLTGRLGFTVIDTVLDVAGDPVVHVIFDVRMHVTASLLAGMYEYDGLSVPTFPPLTLH